MDLLIFDLDGTLIDSKLDLANSVNATRVHMGLPGVPVDEAASWVGNGAPVLIRRAMGPDAPQQDVDRALAWFLEHYFLHMLDNTVLYPGVREGLDEFAQAGLKMAVLTNKPVRFSRALIAGLGVGARFFQVYGGNSFERKKPDPMGVEALCGEAGVEAGRTLMIGDSSVDIRTARNAGIAACGVTWGLQPESLNDPPPDFIVDRMEQLTRWVLAHRGTSAPPASASADCLR
jgi:phosphoglycolate phosphatase